MPATPRKPSVGPITTPAATATKAKAAAHVYKSPDASILSEYVFFPFYDWIVQYYPKRWVPNWITAFGILCTLTASALMFLAMPKTSAFPSNPFTVLPQPDPSAASTSKAAVTFQIATDSILNKVFSGTSGLLIVAGILNGIYCIADNTDGRQARRTKQTSLIGEYLDHGLDCVTALMSTYLVTLCLGQSLTAAMLTTSTIATVTLAAHVLHFTDKIFIWGNRVVSVDEAMVGFAVAPVVHVLAGGPAASKIAFDLDFIFGEGVIPRGYSVLDPIIMAFVVLQATILFGLLAKNWKNAVDFSFILILAINVIMFLLAGMHTADGTIGGVGLPPALLFLPYPAIWGITYAFAASVVSHIPIVAQCGRINYQPKWPVVVVVPGLIAFAVDPMWGMLLLVAGHAVQLLHNIRFIQITGAARIAAAAAKQS